MDTQELLADARELGVKAFLSPLPPAAGFSAVTPHELAAAAKQVYVDSSNLRTFAIVFRFPWLLPFCLRFQRYDLRLL